MNIERIVKLAFPSIFVSLLFGCGQQTAGHYTETGFNDAGKVQVQFYEPTGAVVTVGQPGRRQQIGTYGDGIHRLENTPEQTATFNLSPGSYDFKYTAAKGWEGASIYGELDVYGPSLRASRGTKEMFKQCFVPIALPSPGTADSISAKDDIFPYQSPSYRLRISNQDVKRLAAGDMITKVVFIADLKEIKDEAGEIEVNLTTLNGRKQRLQAMLNEAQLEQLENPSSKTFIKLQTKLKVLDQTIEKEQNRLARLNTLLRADKVLIRREMMVLATDELLPRHEDPVSAAKKLGQIVLVMRLGGRHHQWGRSAQELTAYNN